MKRNTILSETFAVSKGDLERITAEALRRGGNYCDLFFESTFFSTLLLRDGEVSSGGHHEDYGCGIRVLSGEKTGYAYSESTEMDPRRRGDCGRERLGSPGIRKDRP